MKKLIISMIITVLLITVVTYAYVVNQIRTDDYILKIGNPDISGVELTPLFTSDKVLVPKFVTTSQPNEVKSLTFTLYIASDVQRNYTLDTDLPPEWTLTTDRVGYAYQTGVTYTLTLELSEQVDYATYTFYLWVNFQ